MKTQSKSYFNWAVSLSAAFLCCLGAQADSLWTEEPRLSQFSDKKAFAIGDIVTVVVQESNTTRKDSSTQTSKKTGLDASIDSFLFSPDASRFMTKGGKLPALKMQSQNDFQGGGKINNTESIMARFGVRVVDVLPNNNLLVEGQRQTSFSGESQTVILRGTLRPADITPNNTVFSYNLADVSLKFEGKGAVSSTQRKGWFTKAFDVLNPF
jgi:flagellar L-ring protein precursor FlgH